MLEQDTVISESSDENLRPESPSRSKKRPSASGNKRSYTVTCASAFRDAVNDLAAQRGGNAADLARSVVLLLPAEAVMAFPDPGEPDRDDRETVVLKSGPSAGRPWSRKPRLQVRMADGYEPELIRRALGIALAMAEGDARVSLTAPGIVPESQPEHTADGPDPQVLAQQEEICRLRTIVSALSFQTLPNGINSRDEALYVLGFAPGRRPGMDVIKSRYRERATIHHPDSDQGSHLRMSQVNEAMEVLRRSAV